MMLMLDLAPSEFILIGGVVPSGDFYEPTRTTEIVSFDTSSVKEGPMLPDLFYNHCSVSVGDTVYLIGGYETREKVLAISLADGSMNYMAPMQTYRGDHTCATMEGPDGDTLIVVAGGNDGTFTKVTEIYSIATNSWKLGIQNVPLVECSKWANLL